MLSEFNNEAFLDFTKPELRQRQLEAIAAVEARLGQEHPMVIGGERVTTRDKFRSLNPSDPNQVVGVFQKGGEAEARRAVEVADKAFSWWRFVPAHERASVLLRAAAAMRRRRHELNALLMLEVGKSWAEADADTAEAIDFLEFYAREAIRLSGPQPVGVVPGELTELHYIPLGVAVVIPPWNFPLAITCGMTTAALVAGNAVVLKPSSDAPLIATVLHEILEQAGAPAGTVNLLTGPGGSAGEPAVAHPRARLLAFTGSKDVGLRLNEVAARTQPGQMWVKRAILEMGGKDFIVVDDECDLDAAAAAVVASAFGFQGQKCSACSRAIVVEKVYDELLRRIVPLTEALKVGPAKEPDTFMGPVGNQGQMKDVQAYIDVGRKEGRRGCGGEPAPGNGYFLKPTIFADVAPTARIAREEIFGPVLAVIKARDVDHAIELANDTEYGLTGSIFTKSPEKAARARKLLHCGNLYVNRKCTGALVAGHPFGGFNMSGTDSKAGGRDYLLLFTQAKSIAEKLEA